MPRVLLTLEEKKERQRLRNKAYLEKNKEVLNARARAKYVKKGRAPKKILTESEAEDKRLNMRDRIKKYNQENKDCIKEKRAIYNATHKKENAEYMRVYSKINNAKKNSIELLKVLSTELIGCSHISSMLRIEVVIHRRIRVKVILKKGISKGRRVLWLHEDYLTRVLKMEVHTTIGKEDVWIGEVLL